MVAAARQLPFVHMPCVAHIFQRTITGCLRDSGFNDSLAKYRKIEGHFKHSPANTEELHQGKTALGQKSEPLIQDVSDAVYDLSSPEEPRGCEATLCKRKHKLTMLITTEWDRLQRLATILEPCREKPTYTMN